MAANRLFSNQEGIYPMKFGEAIKAGLKNWANFKGRASRSEYWWFYLFMIIVGFGAYFLDVMLLVFFGVLVFSPLAMIVFFLPSLSLTVRRFHDGNHSGWWLALYPVLSFLIIALLVFMDMSGDLQTFANYVNSPRLRGDITLSWKLPVIGFLYFALGAMGIWFLVWLVSPGTNGSNRFGEPRLPVL